MEGLRAECLDLMHNNVDENNCAALAMLADGHELPDLLQDCIQFASAPANIHKVGCARIHSCCWLCTVTVVSA